MTKLFSDVWVFRLAKCLSREEISRRFFHVLWANGMAPDLCNNDHGKLVKFNRERFDSYSNEDLLVSSLKCNTRNIDGRMR
jgi:hypothetical protein